MQEERPMRDTYPVKRVLAVMAHPDDPDVRCGGTIGRWTSEGKEVAYVIVTPGNRGGDGSLSPDRLAAVRQEEQRAAAKTLGVASVRFLGYEDGYLTPSLDLRRDIAREIRRFRPDVVITHNPIRHYGLGNHPDHLAVGEATFAAIYPTAQNPMAFPELLDEELEPWVVTWSMAIDAEAPDHFVDIADWMQTKLAAVACHGSQYGEEYLGLAPMISSNVAAMAERLGYPGLRLAEAYKLRFEGHPRDRFAHGNKVPA
jgi:LmbE family N-acetylglucosaminyl deacetylase